MRKLISSIIAVCLLLSTMSFGVFADFSDMPDDWSTEPLTKAVSNGLLTGFAEDNTIRPSANVTRAQMATIMVRAFGATKEADISEFTDVDSLSWYHSYMATAVEMGLFKGDGANLNPEKNITRQEAFVVLARAFSLADGKASEIDSFNDKSSVAAWAVPSVAAIVSNGYAKGDTAGNLNPENNITRAEFAVLMDNLVKQYITEPGTYTAKDIAEGNILIRANDVTIKNAKITGNLIIGDNVKNGGITLTSTTISGSVVNDDDNVKIIKKSASTGGGGGGGGSGSGGSGSGGSGSGNTGNNNPGTEGGNDNPGTDGGNDNPGTEGGNDNPGTEGGNDNPGTEGGNDNPGTEGGNDNPGTDGGNDNPGTEGGNDNPGTEGGNDNPGTEGGNDNPGTEDGGSGNINIEGGIEDGGEL